jgi:hypothetical protein
MATMSQAGRASIRPASSGTGLASLRRPLAVFVAALLLAALVGGVSLYLRRGQERLLARAEAAHSAALFKLQNTERERSEIRAYQPRFLNLVARGLVGQENRLAWIDAIRRSQATRRLLAVSYEIEPQQVVNLSAPVALGDYQLRASRMQLHMGLLHELDLFNLLDDLRAAGLFTVQDCRIKRLEVPPDAGLVPRLTADCTLAWLTLGPPPAAPAPRTGHPPP